MSVNIRKLKFYNSERSSILARILSLLALNARDFIEWVLMRFEIYRMTLYRYQKRVCCHKPAYSAENIAVNPFA